MDKVLIAYNNDSTTILHDFLESCADEAKQICADNGIEYSSVYPPNLSEQNVIGAMPEHQFCFFAGHGDANGIYNEDENAVVSIHTTNIYRKRILVTSFNMGGVLHLYPLPIIVK